MPHLTTSAAPSATNDPRPGDRERAGADHGRLRSITFRHALLAIAAGGLLLRIVYIFGLHQDYPLLGDAWVYHNESRYIANGHPFISPWAVLKDNRVVPTADHPPLYIVFLTLAWLLGIQDPLAQMAINGLIGAATVVLIGLLTRRVLGERAGLIAAVIAALYPGLWSWNGQLLSESLSVLITVAMMLFAYRAIARRSTVDLTLTIVFAVLAALTRGELVLFLPLVCVPLAWGIFRRTHDETKLVQHVLLIGAITAALIGPWVAYNHTRFKEPVLLSTGVGRALDSGSCDKAFFGDDVGFWRMECIGRDLAPGEAKTLDESQLDRRYRNEAIQVMIENPGRTAVVLPLRVARMFHLWSPGRQLELDQFSEGREWWVSGSALSTYYALLGLGAYGVYAMYRRRLVLYPLVVPVVVAAVGAMICFGTTRYRAAAEPSFVILAAVGLEVLLRRLGPRHGAPAWVTGEPAVGSRTTEVVIDLRDPPESPSGASADGSPEPTSARVTAAVAVEDEPDPAALPPVTLGFVQVVLPAVAAALLALGLLGAVAVQALDHEARNLHPVSQPVPPLPPG